MNTETLDRLDADLRHLPLDEQVWLMERLAQYIRANAIRQQHMIEGQLSAMAPDPDIQHEINANESPRRKPRGMYPTTIQAEFAVTESDGLADGS
jgi:hypothetical protein